AQLLDRRFHYPDTISTAWYFTRPELADPDRPEAFHVERIEPLIDRQRRQAEELLEQISLREAFPLELSRVHLAALVLVIAAIALFGYRYYSSNALDFRRQLASLHIPFVDAEGAAPLMTGDETLKPEADSPRSPLADYQPPYDPGRERLDGTYDDLPDITGVSVSDLRGEGNESSENSTPSDSMNLREQLSKDPRRQAGGQGKDGRDGERRSAEKKESLFDKFQQAMNNMMDKFAKRNETMDQRGEQGKSQDGRQKSEQPGDGSDDSSDREGNQRTDTANNSENAKQGLGGQQGQQTDQQSNSTDSEKSSDAPSSAGAQDGKKDLAAARQLEAMGKIAEILGQRADQVKGDMKVEVQPRKEQSLATELRDVKAAHHDTGGDVSRDEVPLRFQNYVRAYMKNARAAEPAPAPPKVQTQN
ncbi:MAG: hypothetical protein LC114_18830, partial [Bryobacterales bacterium]|nr:hypothetical protein [Bryobacterales bacterium]